MRLKEKTKISEKVHGAHTTGKGQYAVRLGKRTLYRWCQLLNYSIKVKGEEHEKYLWLQKKRTTMRELMTPNIQKGGVKGFCE